MYCESARSGSAAPAVLLGHTAVMMQNSAAERQQPPLRKKREPLNHHLDTLRGRFRGRTIAEQRDVQILGANVRHTRGEQPLSQYVIAAPRNTASNRLERHAARLPAERVRHA